MYGIQQKNKVKGFEINELPLKMETDFGNC